VFTDKHGEPCSPESGEQPPTPVPFTGAERDRDERRRSQLETERWERLDRRVERYALLAIFFLGAVAAVVLAAPGAPVAISVLAGLRLRAVSGRSAASIWDWLILRQEGKPHG